ncbi:MAG: ParB-like nuclease domain-containing protein [Lachnospiraceae bacterium]|nr:ParB-like nuclease domain-containing protein [Lachnospiraceae bacterium]
MAGSTTDFEQFLQGEIKKYRGVTVPIRASMAERMLRTKLPCNSLHPNPADEFCIPSVGPSYRIIGEYEEKFRKAIQFDNEPMEEPLIVQKIHPDGYLLLNGHHRWAAAIRCGIKKVPVKIVNLTQDTDIEKVIQNSKHDKRVSLDLDEVILRTAEDEAIEKAPGFPFNRVYTERLKKGVPALFHYLAKNGYDIWLFSANYYSYDYIRHLFWKHHAHVDAIVTGTQRKAQDDDKKKAREISERVNANYKETLTIDNSMVLKSERGSKDFEQFDINGGDSEWSAEVIAIVEKIVKDAANE